MKRILYPPREQWAALLKRPATNQALLREQVMPVIKSVREEGDVAVKAFTQQFDGVLLDDFAVRHDEIEAASERVPEALKKAIREAAENIETFHLKQSAPVEMIETMPGVRCWRKNIGIEKVGLYIPGGTAPLFSTILMLAIPARIAQCREVILCSPPAKDGSLHPAILYAAKLTGIRNIYKVGGVQAIAAMAYGTEIIPQVYKIFGPGNQYVTCAKQLVQQDGVAIDMPAGPSEVCVLADETAVPAFVAADLLSQAEHGADSQVLLVTYAESLLAEIDGQLAAQLNTLPRKEIAQQALANSMAIVLNTREEAITLVNEYAAEHLIIACADDEAIAEQIVNAGSVFLGNYSPESAGDYASGTNHTLPTNGYARAYSGVSLDSFVKKITYQKLTRQGLDNISETVMLMAAAEGLDAHANAVALRTKQTAQT